MATNRRTGCCRSAWDNAVAAEIDMPPGCGNSPKNKFLAQLCVAAFGLNPLPTEIAYDDAIEFIGFNGAHAVGMKAILDAISSRDLPTKLVLGDVATHGKSGFIDGVVSFVGDAQPFALKVRFKSAAAKSVTQVRFYKGV
jgi:hypothetical protein